MCRKLCLISLELTLVDLCVGYFGENPEELYPKRLDLNNRKIIRVRRCIQGDVANKSSALTPLITLHFESELELELQHPFNHHA